MLTYEKPSIRFLFSDPKLPALKRAITRVCNVNPRLYILMPNNPGSTRFVALWKARNRRTRVLMFRARREVQLNLPGVA